MNELMRGDDIPPTMNQVSWDENIPVAGVAGAGGEIQIGSAFGSQGPPLDVKVSMLDGMIFMHISKAAEK